MFLQSIVLFIMFLAMGTLQDLSALPPTQGDLVHMESCTKTCKCSNSTCIVNNKSPECSACVTCLENCGLNTAQHTGPN